MYSPILHYIYAGGLHVDNLCVASLAQAKGLNLVCREFGSEKLINVT